MDKKLIATLQKCLKLSPEKAIQFMKSQGYEVTWNWREQLEVIKKHAFTVAKVVQADLLQMIHDEIIKATEEGKLYKEFKDSITEKFSENGFVPNKENGAWRLDVIYRTNLQSAYMAGRFYEMKDSENDFPYWQYIAVLDDRTRPSHAYLNGKVLKSNDSFWSISYPPNGYRCRCRVTALDGEYVKKNKLKVRSGTELNYKPDDGFETNPAEAWKPDFTKYETGIRKELEKVIE